MAYEKTVWKNNEAPKINATNLNKMENGIANAVATDSIARVNNVVSKNKFNMYNLNPFTSSNITYSGNLFTVTGKIGDNKAAKYIITLQPGTYILSGTITGAADFIEFYKNGTWDGTISINTPFTLNETTELMMYFYGSTMSNNTTATSTFTNIQLEEGSTATPYTPYLNMQELEKNSIINNYSTGEQVIGKWIDGKPLYRKVIQPVIIIGANATVSVPHGISNLSQVLKVDATLFWSNKTYPFPAIYEDLSKQVAINYIDSTNVYIKSFGENWSTQITTIILEYTKTTD